MPDDDTQRNAPRHLEWKIDGWWYHEQVWTLAEWERIPPRDRPDRAQVCFDAGVVTLLTLAGRADD